MTKIKVSVTLDTDVLDEIRDRAQQDQRTLSNYIDHVLKQYLAQVRESHSTDRRES